MSTPPIVVREDTTLEDVANTMLQHGIGAVPVVDATGRLTGIITESDFTGKEDSIPFTFYKAPKLLGAWLSEDGVARITKRARTMRAAEVMCSPVITAKEDEPVEVVIERMIQHGITRIPVVRAGQPIGLIARHDLLRMYVNAPRS